MGKDILKIDHYVFVCNGKDCKKHRAKEVVKAIQFELKRKGLRDESHIVKTKCMGFCKQGPVVLFKDDLYTKVKPQECEDILLINLKKKEASIEAS